MLRCSFAARFAAMSLVLVSAVGAQAYNIDLMSHGNYVLNSGSFTVNEIVIWENANATIPTLTTMTYTDVTSVGPPFNGTGVYTNGTDSFSFSFAFDGDIPTDGSSSTQTAHGLWTYTSGTGGFANLTGSGVISTNFNAPLGQTSLTEVSGALTPVPEPASMAILGLGAAALIRRRRKS